MQYKQLNQVHDLRLSFFSNISFLWHIIYMTHKISFSIECELISNTKLNFWIFCIPVCYPSWIMKLVEQSSWKQKLFEGPTEIWTRIAGFKVQSANHYTMGPMYYVNKYIFAMKQLKRILTSGLNSWVNVFYRHM